MQIYGPSHLHGAQGVGGPHSSKASKPVAPADAGPIQDELDISDAGQMIDKVKQVPDVRQDRVAQIRAQIDAGTYETDEKLELTVGRLLDEIG